MSDALNTQIVVDITPSAAIAGAAQVNKALDSIIRKGQSASAANDNLGGTFDQLGKNMAGASAGASSLGSTMSKLNSASGSASAGLKQVGAAAHEAEGGLLGMVEHIGKATLAIAGLTFLVGGIHELAEAFVESSNEATEVASRLAVVTTSAQGLAQAQQAVLDISTQTRSAMTDTAELYQKIGIQADHLKLSTSGIGTATKTFAETLKISGATQQQAAGSMRQLGEAFDLGKLSGVHYQAMMADNIVFMRLLAQSMGVPMGKLKEMSTQGKVTAGDLKKALTDPKLTDDVQKRFDRMPVSFADARMAIHNSLIQLAGDFGKGAGLNDALKSFYDKIASFGTTAGPAFEKIGAAARAAFSAIAPAASAAFQAIGPVFSFVLDNGPAIISVLKVAAEGWLAYKAASLAVAAVPLAASLATEVQFLALVAKEVLTGASSFAELGKALKAATGAQVLFNAVAELNPYVLAATAIVTVIGLLYEFSDAIKLGGGTMASLGDLFRAIWEDIKGTVSAAVSAVEGVFSGLWNGIKSGVEAVGSYLGSAFSVPLNAISDLWTSTFGDLDLSLAGILTGAARIADGLVGVFRGSTAAIGVLFNELPGLIYQSLSPTLQGIVDGARTLVTGIGSAVGSVYNAVAGFGSSLLANITSVFNSISGFIEKWANKAIGGINTIINAADRLGAGIEKVGEVKLGQIAAPKVETAGWSKLGTDVGAAFNSGFGHEAENGVKGLLAHAGRIAKGRQTGTATTLPPVTSSGVPDGDGDGDPKKKDKDAERRAKQEKEFWGTLKGEVETAKLLPLAAEDYKKQLDLQKIRGKEISDQDKARIADLMAQARTAKFLTDALDTHNKSQLEANNQEQEFRNKLSGMTTEQQAVEKSVLDFRTSALEKGVDIQTQAYKVAEDQLRVDQQRLQTINQQNKALDSALDSAKTYSKTYDAWQSAKDLRDKQSDFESTYNAAVANGTAKDIGLTKEVHDEVIRGFAEATTEAANQWATDMATQIDSIAQAFGGKIGAAIGTISKALTSATKAAAGDFSGLGAIGGVLSLFSKKDKNGNPTSDFGKEGAAGAQSMLDKTFKSDTWTKPFASMSSSFSELKDSFTNGGFAKGMGKALGQAGVGVQIGDSVQSVLAPLGKALGVKTSKTGAEIGGALGSVFGPVGSVIGSIGGSLLGGLFKKAPKGGSSIDLDAYGNLAIGNTFGNNSKAKAASVEGANAVISGLDNIAQTLGGVLSGDPSVVIGTYNGKWRVQTDGSNHLGGANHGAADAVDFGKDGEADAVAFAIQAAVKQGVITGISSLSTKILSSDMDSDAALSLATNWEKVLKSLESWQDPVKYAAENVTKQFDTLKASLTAAGASADDLSKLQTERDHELQEALKDLTSGYTDLLNTINGASGKSSFQLLNEEMAQFQSYQKDIASGVAIDQDDYSTLVNNILQNAGDVYDPNNSQYQAIISTLRDTTTDQINSLTDQFNADAGTSTTDAVNAQTSAITAAQAVQTDYLSQIASGINNLNAKMGSGGSGSSGAVNGKLVQAY